MPRAKDRIWGQARLMIKPSTLCMREDARSLNDSGRTASVRVDTIRTRSLIPAFHNDLLVEFHPSTPQGVDPSWAATIVALIRVCILAFM